MNISAIIAEYNPLHKGHLYQIDKTRELTGCEGLVCIMSGNFVQRGEPAIIDKWARTRMALENGIDLVLELPVAYSLSSAEFFAHGSVTILHKLGIIDNICFGSEAGNTAVLYKLAEILINEPEEYTVYLKNFLSEGDPYPVARSRALRRYIKERNLLKEVDLDEVLNNSNNILGIEYCKSLIRNGSKIKPVTVKREGGAYNSSKVDARFSSATAIRKLIRENSSMDVLRAQLPENSFKIFEELWSSRYDFTFDDSMFPFIRYKCLQNKESLAKLPDATEGLHNRIYEAAASSSTMQELIMKVKTKRYTYTRISRILSQLFIGFDHFDISKLRISDPQYVRVLGLNDTGREILKKLRKNEEIDVLNKIPGSINEMLELDVLSTRMYSLINKNVRSNEDFLTSPIKY